MSQRATVASGGTLAVSSGGTLSAGTISGLLTISAGGTVIGATLASGGVETIASGGVSQSATVASGGTLGVSSGGTVSAGTISGLLSVSAGGTAIGETIASGGIETIASGGVSQSAMVASGGLLNIGAGGGASNTAISVGGRIINSGGSIENLSFGNNLPASSLILGAGGTLDVASPTDGLSTDVNLRWSGTGTLLIAGSASFVGDLLLAGGTIELGRGASLGQGSIIFTNPGSTLRLDDLLTSSGSLANALQGFESGDVIDLAGMAYSSSASATLVGHTLQIDSGGNTFSIELSAAHFAAIQIADDGSGGTLLTAVASTTAPAAPVITNLSFTTDIGASHTDGVTSNALPWIMGSSEAYRTIRIMVDGSSVGTTTASVNGAWSFPVLSALADGSHSITATATDSFGNTSADSNAYVVTIDTRAPSAPAILGLTAPTDTGISSSDGLTSLTKPTLAGSAEAYGVVKVLSDSVQLGTTTADGSGAWVFTPAADITPGTHSLTATVMDIAGNVSAASASYQVTVDSAAPAAPVITGLRASTDTGASSSDGITRTAAPTLTGSAEANSILTISVDGSVAGSTTAASGGTWSFGLATLSDGNHSITATAADRAGNAGPASAIYTVKIVTSLAAPIITGLSPETDSGLSASDGVTNVIRPGLRGTAAANSTVTILSDGLTIGSVTASASGAWTLALAAALVPGTHSITATSGDLAGNSSVSAAAYSVTIDAVAPAAPVITGLTPDTDTGASHSDGITSNATPVITGTAEANSRVSLKSDGILLGTATSSSNGNWFYNIPSALSQGSHILTATATDLAGNSSAVSGSYAVIILSAVSAVPVITGLTSLTDSGASNSDGITNNVRPTIIGTAGANSYVTIMSDGVQIGITTANAMGAWSFAPTTALAQGSHSVTATAADLAGNVSTASSPYSIVIDNVAPSTPQISGITAETDTGISSIDGITSNTRPTLIGTASAGVTIAIASGSIIFGSVTANNLGVWSFTPSSPIAQGSYSITARASDLAGNVSSVSANDLLVIQTGAPRVPTIIGLTAATDSGANHSDGLTNNTSPTLTGTADFYNIVNVKIDGISVGTTGSDANGVWSLAANGLSSARHSVTATATNATSQVSAASLAYDVTVVASTAAPVIKGLAPETDTGTSQTDGITSNKKPIIIGTAAANASITVVIDGSDSSSLGVIQSATAIGTVSADAAGNWNFAVPVALAQGSHSITAVATDLAGNVSVVSASYTMRIQGVIPSVPVIIGLTSSTDSGASGSDGRTSIANPTLIGTADSGIVLQIMSDGSVIGSTTAGSTGAWSLAISAPLSPGSHRMTATAVAIDGSTSAASTPYTIVIDTIAPTAPVITGLTGSTDTGASQTDGITNNTQPTLIGTAAAGSTVAVTIDGSLAGTTAAGVSGTWYWFIANPLSAARHSVTATATSAAGSISPVATAYSIVVQTSIAAPAIIGLIQGNDTGLSSADGITAHSKPGVFGTAAANSVVTITVDDIAVGSVIANSNAEWSFGLPTVLSQGSHALRAQATDVAGNISLASSPYAILIDSKPPAAPLISGLSQGTDTGTSNSDGITSNPNPILIGSAEAFSLVSLTLDGSSLVTTTANSNGTWTVGLSGLASGRHNMTVTATDTAGNVSAASAAFPLVVDTIAPGAPAITGLTAATDTGVSSVDGITSIASPTLLGTAEGNASITILAAGIAVGATIANNTGAWSFTPQSALNWGSYSLTAIATDLAGNQSAPSASTTITIDGQAPIAPVIAGLKSNTDTGRSNSDGITSNTRPTLTGSAAANAVVVISLDGAPLASVSADSNGTWSLGLATSLSPGGHSIAARTMDAAGNTSAAAVYALVVDAAAPSAPIITGLTPATDTGTSNRDGMTNNTNPILIGSAEASSAVTVFVDGVLADCVTAATSGVWSFAATGLPIGSHTITASAADVAGNFSPLSAPYAVLIKTSSAAPVITGLTAATDSGSSPSDGITRNTKPTLSGTAPANSVVTIRIDGSLVGTTTSGIAGTWSFAIAAALAQGSHSITATASDLAGNLSAASTSFGVQIKTTPPPAPIISGLTTATDTGISTTDGITSITTPAILGTAEANSTITVLIAGRSVGTVAANSSGVWLFNVPTALAQGAYAISATATDLAGNQSSLSASKSIVIDTTPPAAPQIKQLTSTASATISGTATPGTVLTVTNTINGSAAPLYATTVASTGAWSFNATGLIQGANHIAATVTDTAGLVSAAGHADFVYDTVPPDLTLSLTRSGGASSTLSAIYGTGNAGDTITLSNGSQTIGTAVVGLNSAWSFLPSGTAAHAAGVVASDKDAAGNTGISIAGSKITLTLATAPVSHVIDTGSQTTLNIGKTLGSILLELTADSSVMVDLIGSVSAGLASLTSLKAALGSDGNGGALLHFGTTMIDFVGIAPTTAAGSWFDSHIKLQ